MGLDEHGVIETANARAAALTGRSVDDLVGRSFLGLVADDDRGTVTERWKLGSDADRGDDGTTTAPARAGTCRCSRWSTWPAVPT